MQRISGGLPVGPDGRIHGAYKHDPSTLRLSMAAPNLTNIPRGGTELQDLVRSWFETPGQFWARDYAGIEAILVGYFANAPRVMRIFRLDGHSYFTAYAEYELNKSIPFADLPREEWSDADLKASLNAIKKKFKKERTHNKQITHGANYLETAPMAQIILLNNTGILMEVKAINRVMDFYRELFPEIPRWHQTLAAEVGGAPLRGLHQGWGYETRQCFVRGPFKQSHRYYDTVKWERTPKGWEWSLGEDAKRLVAFLPQSTARFLLTRAAQRIWDRDSEVGRSMRLFIHDEILGETLDEALLARALHISREEMERPIPELVLPDGSLIQLGTEAKVGPVWGSMKEVTND